MEEKLKDKKINSMKENQIKPGGLPPIKKNDPKIGKVKESRARSNKEKSLELISKNNSEEEAIVPRKDRKPIYDEKKVFRQLLQQKIKEIYASEAPHERDEDRELDVCMKPGDRSTVKVEEVHDIPESPRLSLPKYDRTRDRGSSDATYSSSQRNSFEDTLLNISLLRHHGLEHSSSTSVSAGSSNTESYCTSKASLDSSDSCRTMGGVDSPSNVSLTAGLRDDLAKIRLSSTTLHYIAKPLIDRPEFGRVIDPSIIAREREKEVQIAAAAGKAFGITTESKEFIKRDPEFIIPGPNPKRIPHDELMNSFKGFTNMFLAHEISLNEKFQLEQYIPSADSIEERVKTQLKSAFWDLFTQEVHADPPDYGRVLPVLKEVKDTLLGLILPDDPENTKAIENINKMFDMELIVGHIADQTFAYGDLFKYSRYAIDTLAHICSPAHNSELDTLKDLNDPAQIFETIFSIAENLKLDFANICIHQFRPTIIKHCAQYERIKFADYFEQEYKLGEDGLRATRIWLSRHTVGRRDVPTILAKAFVEFLALNWNEEIPETLTLDIVRYRAMTQKILRWAVIGAIAISVGALAQLIIPELPKEFRDLIKKRVQMLITEENVTDMAKFHQSLDSATIQAISLVQGAVTFRHNRQLTTEETQNIRQCVHELQNPNNKVRSVIYRRIVDYAEEVLISQYQYHVPVPAGLYSIRAEVVPLVSDYAQIVWHNRIVYGELYSAIIEKKVGRLEAFDTSDQVDFVKVMQILHRENILNRPSPMSPGPGSRTSSISC